MPIFPRAMVRANNPPRVPALASHETVVHGFTRVAARLLQGAWRFSKIGLMLTAAMIAPIFLPPPPPPKPRDPQAQTDPDDKDKDEN